MRYLVYTAVTGKYDKVNKILGHQDPNIDFVCFTDQVKKDIDLRKQTGWLFRPIPRDLDKFDNRRKARMIKVLIYQYAKDYDGYLWIDAPIVIHGNLGPFFASHPFDNNHGLYVSKHYMRDCVYQEFAQVIRLKKDLSNIVYNQYDKYKNMNYPAHNGMAETSILYRNLKDLKVQVHAATWAQEITEYSYRDQLSFNWSAWYTKTPITYLTEHIYIKDTENETSDYFFLPWPKHDNNRVYDQLRACLENRRRKTNDTDKAKKIQVKLDSFSEKHKAKEQVDNFEKEYQEFIENLKKKKAEEEEEKNKKIEVLENDKQPETETKEEVKSELSADAPKEIVKPQRKRGRPRKAKKG